MNRRALLAGAAALALSAAPAFAQGSPVYDNASLLKQAAVWLKQAADMKAQFEMMQATWNALSGARDMRGVAAALGGPARTFMPESGLVLDLFNGSSGTLWGAAGWMQRAARYADVGQDTPWAREMQRRETVTANAKAIAGAGLESSQRSIFNLSSLVDRLSGAPDVTEISAVGGALQVEQQNLDNHRGQIDQVRLMLAAADREDAQRAEQMRWESARDLFEGTRPFGGISR